jgi:hypothetical protein
MSCNYQNASVLHVGGKCIKMGAVLFLETATSAPAGGSQGSASASGEPGIQIPGLARPGRGGKGGRPGHPHEPPLDTGAPESVMSHRGMELRYEVATKVYFFHYAR